ncbi:MAG: DUF739 domain-containing protein [Lachnospiraceae bacterium]|nr:DUF739 domain-containing protein [Lachnospiraceae bacterium]
MINTDKLRGIIVERRTSGMELAKSLGISQKTFYDKMKKGVFGSDEIDKMIEILEIDNPTEIFFAQCVNHEFTD